MDEEELSTLKYEVGKAMSNNPLFRTHRGREALVKHIKTLNIKCSMVSITRCQRKLWEIAINEIEVGNYEYAFKLLPSNKADFEEWMVKRKVDANTYRKYFAEHQTFNTQSFICRKCNRTVKGNPHTSDNICHNCKRVMFERR